MIVGQDGKLGIDGIRNRVIALVIFSLFLLFCIGLYLVFKPFLVGIAWAVVIALSTWSFYRRISVRYKLSPNIAALLMTTLVAIVITAAIAPVVLTVIGEFDSFNSAFQNWLKNDAHIVPQKLRSVPLVGDRLALAFESIKAHDGKVLATFSEYQNQIYEFVKNAAKGVAGVFFKFFVCMLTLFFLYRDGGVFGQEVQKAMHSLGGSRTVHILNAIRNTSKASVYGLLFTAFAQGVLAGFGYLIAGIPIPFLLAFLTMVMSMIPFGTPLIYMPAAIWLLFQDVPWWYGTGLALWGMLVVSTADNFIRSIFISQATRMPILLVLIGVLGGLAAFGMIGIFIGPVLIAVANVLINEFLHEKQVLSTTT